jgi:hypothetical protein
MFQLELISHVSHNVPDVFHISFTLMFSERALLNKLKLEQES